MKLTELADTKHELDLDPLNGLEYNQIYTYEPKLVTDENGYNQRIVTVYSYKPNHIGKKSYAMLDQDVLQLKILNNTHHDGTSDNVMKVRIVSNVNQKVSRYSLVNNSFTKKPNGERITFDIKDLPDFENYDRYTDKEFQEEFGRPRLDEDRGLVGYLFIENELDNNKTKATSMSQQSNQSEKSVNTNDKDEKNSKMDSAVAIYRANKPQGRKRVIELFKRQLGMTAAGASSYYTKAMHAVEDNA